MLRHDRNSSIEQVIWKSNDPRYRHDVDRHFTVGPNPECVRAIEAWRYENIVDADRDNCWRCVDLADTSQYLRPQNEWQDEFHEKVEQFLDGVGGFAPRKPVPARTLQGGFRIILCEREDMVPCMTLTRHTFEKIETRFDLHNATLPAFFDHGGSFMRSTKKDENARTKQIQIVLKVKNKFEIGNCLLSLTHDVGRRWSDCFICGHGVVRARTPSDNRFGRQADQLLSAITQCSMEMWNNPLLLPASILQICVGRTATRVRRLEETLLPIETHLGVTFAGRAGTERERPEWPMDIEIEKSTRELHSLLPKVLQSEAHVHWQLRYAEWLLQSEAELSNDSTMHDHNNMFNEIKSTLNFFTSRIAGNIEFFEVLRGRTQSQIDLLFNVISQHDAQMSRNANDLNLEVARSTKEDSISMSTFTFITALFLPPSFVATLFSMSMFSWSTGDTSSNTSQTVSNNFWIFWVVAAPLTALTMGGWFIWYGHANRKWQRRLGIIANYPERPQGYDETSGDKGANPLANSETVRSRRLKPLWP